MKFHINKGVIVCKLLSILLLCLGFVLAAPKPMESIEQYNIILVHGAASSHSGMDCEKSEQASSYGRGSEYKSLLSRIPGTDAVGMIKELYPWLSFDLFEGDTSLVYLQRPFTNPANSPMNNAREIGSPLWGGGEKGCTERRSLIEEAKEVVAISLLDTGGFGRDVLKDMRKYPYLYRALPSRNILIAHSMGGVASREYVQGDFYNQDVDKVVTLDSPHEGTGSLNLLLYKDITQGHHFSAADITIFSSITAYMILSRDFATMAPIVLALAGYYAVATGIDFGILSLLGDDYDYKRTDLLVDYIDPSGGDNNGINNLKKRPVTENLPMFRLLGGRYSMTFSDPNLGMNGVFNSILPDHLVAPFGNIINQYSGGGSVSTNFVNAATSWILGIGTGLILQEHGTTLVPEASGMATHTKVLNNPSVDVKRSQYDGNVVSGATYGLSLGTYSTLLVSASVAIVAADIALSVFYPALVPAVKSGLGIVAAITLAGGVGSATTFGLMDILNSHKAPSMSEYQSQWKGDKNTYSLVSGGTKTVEPYLMEDFLYEKPFVNLKVSSANDWLEVVDSTFKDSIGLYQFQDSVPVPLAFVDMKKIRSTPLTFSAAGWEKLGVKVDRWERVDGLDANGNLAAKSVPIRHVERYEVPAIVVEDFIELYSFIVDDLMPHRLRQIRMNFNFQEEIAWECDISKEPEASDNCKVYKRTSDGQGWMFFGSVAHPVKKDGSFDFIPADYGYDNLLAIQKDNQNSFVISTVNKIGLSNSQRFYYLFKATADLFVPEWPLHDVVLSRVDSFSVFASTLDYQGFSVAGGSSTIFSDTSSADDSMQAMNLTEIPGFGFRLQTTENLDLSEGGYVFKYQVSVLNNGEQNSSRFENVPFKIDRTAPLIALTVDQTSANPDSAAFLARFRNDITVDNELRLVRFQLERFENGAFNTYSELPALYHVASPEFAVSWDGLDSLADGRYRITAFAIDRALPNRAAYDSIHSLVNKIITESVTPSDWEAFSQTGLNSSTASAELYIDRTAPEITVKNISALKAGPEMSFVVPEKNPDLIYIHNNEQLKIDYSVQEPLMGRDSAAVSLNWSFVHVPDTAAADQAGLSLLIRTESGLDSVWEEYSGMRFSDGDYLVRLQARDAAGNQSQVLFPNRIRVDRTAPQILSLVSSRLTYPDSAKDFQATLRVSQAQDTDSNKSDLNCYYRVLGNAQASDWALIRKDTVSKKGTASFTFDLAPALVGVGNGKRYLEAGCVDAAGNFGFLTDLFHVGELYPSIVSPDSSDMLESPVIAIYGTAPASGKYMTDSAVYRLRYRAFDSDVWLTAGLDVGAGKRSSSAKPWISNGVQPVEGLLGLWDRTGLEGAYVIELGVRSCGVCDFITDSMTVYLAEVKPSASEPSLVLSAPVSIIAGESSERISLRLANASLNYSVRLYGEDANGVGLFEVSADSLRGSPYRGTPADTTLETGLWFYGEDSVWNLKWRGLTVADTLLVKYDQSGLSLSCEGITGNLTNCISAEFEFSIDSASLNAVNVYAKMMPELFPVSFADKQMKLYGNEGHLIIRAEKPFQVDLMQLSQTSLPMYIGSNHNAGFPYGGTMLSLEAVKAWSVDPSLYGLYYSWDAISGAGTYPQGGFVTVYAEVVENTAESPLVFRDSAQILITLPPLQVVSAADSLPHFTVLESSNHSELILGKMTASYEILGRSALVSAYILNAAGDTIKTLFTNQEKRAGVSKTAYSIVWDGMDDNHHAVTHAGDYRLVVTATENNPENPDDAQSAVLSRTFKLFVAPGMNEINLAHKDSSTGPLFSITEAVDDMLRAGEKRYEPIADYLIKADLSGMFFPDSLRKVKVDYYVEGTQKPLGFSPERFSLAIKRQRETLDLVYLTKVNVYVEQMDDNWFGCEATNHKSDTLIYHGDISFSTHQRIDNIDVYIQANSVFGAGYGYDNNKEYHSKIDLIVMLKKDWEVFNAARANSSARLTVLEFDNLKNNNAVWKLSDVSKEGYGASIPIANSSSRAMSFGANTNVGCVVDQNSENFCVYESDSTKNTPNYNPNNNLFSVYMFGRGNPDYFYEDYETIDSDCGEERWRKIAFNIRLTIPDSYWDADFGYDNLVNRTIRFDHTNKTIFGAINGYLKALQDHVPEAKTNYFNGESWQENLQYGLLTPFEAHKLPFVSASTLSGGLNTFLFPDETPQYQYPSYFHLKFYHAPQNGGEFVAKITGSLQSNSMPDSAFVASNNQTYKTPLYNHGNVNITVGLNQGVSESNTSETIPYPAPEDWQTLMAAQCEENYTAAGVVASVASCKKYYNAGSKVHYYYNDYADAAWNLQFLTSTGYIKNPVNSSIVANPNALTTLSINAGSINSSHAKSDSVIFTSGNYRDGNFYRALTSLSLPGVGVVNDLKTTLSISGLADSLYSFKNDTLYMKAQPWSDSLVYRRTVHSPLPQLPTLSSDQALSLRELYRYQSGIARRVESATHLYYGDSTSTDWQRNAWIKEVQISGTPTLTHLDTSVHSHFYADKKDDSTLILKYNHSVTQLRPSEFVEIRGRVGEGKKIQIAYLSEGEFHPIIDFTDVGKENRITWFDLNYLQGNTTFFMTWGGIDGTVLNYSKLDLNIGSLVQTNAFSTVKSLFGEVSVSFPAGTVSEPLDVTVRTTDPTEYNFNVFNNAALTGPVVEVLPSMTFEGPEYPRVQMKISREELEQSNLSPDRVRLYKVDFENGQFVPLTHILYGYLNASGGAAVNGGSETSSCATWDASACYASNWKYLLLSAETATFSVFAALDSVAASIPSLQISVLPEIGTGRMREIQVSGASDFNLYIDNDSLWNDLSDLTPPELLSFERDSLGVVRVEVPADLVSWIFVVAKTGETESVSAPARAKVQVVPSNIICNLPEDSLWLGLDNGYLRFSQDCNQPVLGVLSFVLGNVFQVEARALSPDSIYFDGIFNGKKIEEGVYGSRYLATSVTGQEIQIAGPLVYTDAKRPKMLSISVEESSDMLDKLFNISGLIEDSESGVALTLAQWNFGGGFQQIDTLTLDSSGSFTHPIRLPRSLLSECLGCTFTVKIHTQDYGHNYADTVWTSAPLYPYPAGIALWYPASESHGSVAHEMIGTGHHLSLQMVSPWLSASGLYFVKASDKAVGYKTVDLGNSEAWTMEAWVRKGNLQSENWMRVMGFKGTTGTEFELQINKNDLRLVEGSLSWTIREALPESKIWSHVAVSADSSEVRFYVDGELLSVKTAPLIQRELYGTFSLGAGSGRAFNGHLQDARFYNRNLSAAEIQALYLNIGSGEDSARVIIALGNDFTALSGATLDFSCAIPGGNFWNISENGGQLLTNVTVSEAGLYKVILYVRALQSSSKQVSVGRYGLPLTLGNAAFEPVWRAVEVKDVLLTLSKGSHAISLMLPEGVQVAGLALASHTHYSASQVTWKNETSKNSSQVLSASVKFEGYPEASMLRPRLQLTNTGNFALNGFSVRYYFRGEDPTAVRVSAFYPSDASGLSVHAENAQLGFVEWDFPSVQVLPGESPFYGQGPHFGIYNENYVPWVADDDPSFVDGAAYDFTEASGIVILDQEKKTLAGYCPEIEDAVAPVVKVKVLAKDTREDGLGSHLYISLSNEGTVALKNYEVRYSFYVEEGLAPVLDVYDMQALSAEMISIGPGRWQVSIRGNASLGPNITWQNPAQFALHLMDWMPAWKVGDDPSHAGLSTGFAEAVGVEVFDSTGTRIYGNTPVWPKINVVENDSAFHNGGYNSGESVPIRLTEDGLVVTLSNDVYLSMDLVNVIGAPIRSIYNGSFVPGEHFIAFDWNGVNKTTTYLMLRMNGKIVSTQKLSTLGE